MIHTFTQQRKTKNTKRQKKQIQVIIFYAFTKDYKYKSTFPNTEHAYKNKANQVYRA